MPCLQCGDVLEVDGAGGGPDSHDRRDDGLIVVVPRPIPCTHAAMLGEREVGLMHAHAHLNPSVHTVLSMPIPIGAVERGHGWVLFIQGIQVSGSQAC